MTCEKRLLPFILWGIAGIACYIAAQNAGGLAAALPFYVDPPRLEAGLWKWGHVLAGSWAAYWGARIALGRVLRSHETVFARLTTGQGVLLAGQLIARALLMVGVVEALSRGL